MNRILIICRDVKSLSIIVPQSDTYYIVASNSIKVQKAAKEHYWVNDTCWIEQMESFFNVADDVMKFVDIINEWLESLSTDKNHIPKELLFWIKHAEGGMTTQRIQDTLLLIRSYINLFKSTNTTSIIVLSHKGAEWENDILFKTAASLNIPVELIGKRHRDIQFFLKLFAREPYYIFRFLQSKLHNTHKSKKCDKEIVFQMCSSANKHLAHTTPLMKSLHYEGYNPIALCWSSPDCVTKIRNMNLNAEHLEKYGSFLSIIDGDFKLLNTWINALKNKNILLNNPELQYKGVLLGSILWSSIQFFFSGEISQRYRLFTAINEYYKYHSPDAIRFWTLTLAEGRIPFENIPFSQSPIIFGNVGFHDLLDNPYKDKDAMRTFDLNLVTGNRQKIRDDKYAGSENKISAIGQVSWEHYAETVSEKKILLKELDINHRYSNYILYDSGTLLRGFLSVQEQIKTVTSLLNFAKEHLSIALLIKPHPNHKVGVLESLINDYSLDNVYFIDKNVSMMKCINVADLLITKWSTSGIEAMYLKTPVISVCLDNDHRFRIYDDVAKYAYTANDLKTLLNNTAFSPEWHSAFNSSAKDFLNDNFYRPTDFTPSQKGAKEIIHSIKRRQNEDNIS